MKKSFITTLALIASMGVCAQTRLVQINTTNSLTEEFKIPTVENMAFDLEVWQEYGTGTYAYNIYWNVDSYYSVEKTDLKVYRSTLHPNRYKIEKWGYENNADFYFTYDEETDSLAAEDQYIGVTDSTYGPIYVDDLVHHNGEYDLSGDWPEGTKNEVSYREGDVFRFSLIYYVGNGGYFGYSGDYPGHSRERLTMTSYASQEAPEEVQTNVMEINYYDGSFKQFDVNEVRNIRYAIDPWNEVGTGEYTFGDIAISGSLSDRTICQHYENVNNWRINNWLSPESPLTFTYDEETGDVAIDNQDTGYYTVVLTTDGLADGTICVCEVNTYLRMTGQKETEYTSYYDVSSDTFYFAIVYYMFTSARKMVYWGQTGDSDGHGYETFHFTSHSATP